MWFRNPRREALPAGVVVLLRPWRGVANDPDIQVVNPRDPVAAANAVENAPSRALADGEHKRARGQRVHQVSHDEPRAPPVDLLAAARSRVGFRGDWDVSLFHRTWGSRGRISAF